MKIFIFLPILLLLSHIYGTHSDKSVITSLNAQWSHTSFLAETSEFISTEGNEYFWNFLDHLLKNKGGNVLTQKQQFDNAVQQATSILSKARLHLLKFALSLRLFSPRIQVFQQIGNEFNSSCAAFVDINNKITCSVDDINLFLKDASTRERSTLYSIDHSYNNKSNSVLLPMAVLYGDIDSSADFAEFHQKLKSLCDDNKLVYVFRHHKKILENLPVGLSGYGVELAIKNTEYKAIDDSNVDKNESEDEETDSDIFGIDFNVLRKNHPELKDSLNQFKMHLSDMEELAPLKQWEVADLSYQAAQRIMDADPAEKLSLLTDLSQNFPIRSRALVQTRVKQTLRDEIAANQAVLLKQYDVSEGENAFYLNGISIDVDSMDIFQLFNTINNEERLANAFYQMGFRREYLSMIYNIDLAEDKASYYAVDYREAYPEYINDLDKDKHYREWGNSVKLLLQPYFPGMIRPIARNLFTMICVVDPATSEGQDLMKISHSLFVHQVPLRIGFVFALSDESEGKSGMEDVGVAILNLYNFAKTDKSPAKAINLVTKLFTEYQEDVTVDKVHKFFKKHFSDQDVSDVFEKDSDYDTGRSAGRAFLRRSGLQSTPKVLINGVVLDDSSLQSDRIEEAIFMQIMKLTTSLQKAVVSGRLTDKDNVQNWVLSQPDVLPRLNHRLLREPTSYLPLYDVQVCAAKSLAEFEGLEAEQRAQCILENSKYFTKSDTDETRWLTIWLVDDFNTVKGRNLLRDTLKALKKLKNTRISIVHNGETKFSAQVINSIMHLYPSNVAKQMIHKLLNSEETVEKLLKSRDFSAISINGANIDLLKASIAEAKYDAVLTLQASFAQTDLGLCPGQAAVIVNGMLYGPLDAEEELNADDFFLLEKIFERKGAKAVAKQIDEWEVSRENDKSSDVVMRAMSVIGKFATKKKRVYVEVPNDLESVINLVSSDATRPIIDIVAVVEPLSRNAQKLSPVLEVLTRVVNCDVKIIMNPKSRLSELPLKRFYRFVVHEEPKFDDIGRTLTPFVDFRELPNKQLFTLNVIPPDAWMVQPVFADYDLDNIKMKTTKKDVIAKFELIHILLEGHCFDEVTGNPPRGLQYILGTKSRPNEYDTIVMANLGYFQLKAAPGAWILRLREGKSADIYEVKNCIESESLVNGEVSVLIDSFLGRTVRIRVAKRPGMEKLNLLSDSNTPEDNGLYAGEDEEDGGGGLWSSLSSTVSKLSGGEKHEKINIFSLASGHLYERFLRIMMLSVIKHTKHPVKFWLLNNYLSPHFRNSVPIMAKKYNFEVELIEYKWPRWLHQQTEKIRIMWGYKILFLDVLFPLDVKKIIFVDADQVVRTDLMELMNLDLGGAPYGYTPFCDSRTSMDGFRFWRQGYWANFLAGRKYHISALYVVDLVKFRQIAAGDRLRGQYQGLSSDPNSLANLDQDLPNNMIHQVRIKSLPQEWLWCETWCSDESKESAKTIDLCNNPLTKEPKLDSAIRIIPEWRDYDNEIKQLMLESDGVKAQESGAEIIREEEGVARPHSDDHGGEL